MGVHRGACGIQPAERGDASNDDAAERRDVQPIAPIGAQRRSILCCVRTIAAVYGFCQRHLFHNKSIPPASRTPEVRRLWQEPTKTPETCESMPFSTKPRRGLNTG